LQNQSQSPRNLQAKSEYHANHYLCLRNHVKHIKSTNQQISDLFSADFKLASKKKNGYLKLSYILKEYIKEVKPVDFKRNHNEDMDKL
jgi:hypothetical protein